MLISVNNEEVKKVDLEEIYSLYKESSVHLLETPTKTFDGKNLLYVQQGEFAVVSPDDEKIKVIGSADATTCHFVIIRHSGSGVTGLAHHDGSDLEQGLDDMIQLITQSSNSISGRLEVHIIGGFQDDRNISQKVSEEILSHLISIEERIHLDTACITKLNNTLKDGIDFPIIYGVGVELVSGKLSPANFLNRGPDASLRQAGYSGRMRNIYDMQKKMMVIEPLSWKPLSDIELWVSAPDRIIRKYLSTSPLQEPDHFVEQMRNSLCFIKDNPNTADFFKNGLPRYYNQHETGDWTLISNFVQNFD